MNDNGLRTPQSKVTQEDVAQRAGVSRGIVSYVINNGHIVHEATTADMKARPEILHRHLGV